jgi:hypothetical protein
LSNLTFPFGKFLSLQFKVSLSFFKLLSNLFFLISGGTLLGLNHAFLLSFEGFGGNLSLGLLNLDGLSPFFGLSFNFSFNFLKHFAGTGDAGSRRSNGSFSFPKILDALQGVLVEHLLLLITEACSGCILILWSWVNTTKCIRSAGKTLGSIFDLGDSELSSFHMALEVKNLLGGAELLTVCYVTGAYAIFTVIGTEIWSIYWSIFTEAGEWLSWMWVSAKCTWVACSPTIITSVLR